MSTGTPSKSVTQKRIEANKPVYKSSRLTMRKEGNTNIKAIYKAKEKSVDQSRDRELDAQHVERESSDESIDLADNFLVKDNKIQLSTKG